MGRSVEPVLSHRKNNSNIALLAKTLKQKLYKMEKPIISIDFFQISTFRSRFGVNQSWLIPQSMLTMQALRWWLSWKIFLVLIIQCQNLVCIVKDFQSDMNSIKVFYVNCSPNISKLRVCQNFMRYFNCSFADMFAIPDYGSGATEHWDIITYRESRLLYTPGVSSEGNKRSSAGIIAHECAHLVKRSLVCSPSYPNLLWFAFLK